MDSKTLQFHVFRYQIPPLSQTVDIGEQTHLPFSNIEELKRKKNSIFQDILFKLSASDLCHKNELTLRPEANSPKLLYNCLFRKTTCKYTIRDTPVFLFLKRRFQLIVQPPEQSAYKDL